MEKYRIIKKIGEGTFAVVVKARSLKDGKYYACKTMKKTVGSLEQAHSLTEVKAMRMLGPHPNILHLHDIIFDEDSGSVSLVCELMEMNVYELIRARRYPMSESKIHNYMYQLCKSLDHLHSNGIFHRDIKPENLLIKHDILKLGDFGSCKSLYTRPPHTEYISTRWYRAPECLLTDGHYSHKMDVWSAGCVFYEIISFRPLFPGSSELDQVSKIHNVLGTPKTSVLKKFKTSRTMTFNFRRKRGSGLSSLIPQWSETSMALLRRMLEYDPDERISSRAALQHLCFREQRLAERRASNLQRPSRVLERGEEGTNPPSAGDHQRYGRRQDSFYAVELPRLHIIPPAPRVYPLLSFSRARPYRERLPAINPRPCHSPRQMPREEALQLAHDSSTLPILARTHGEGS